MDADSSKTDLLAHVRHLESVVHDLEEFGFRIAHDLLDPARKIRSYGELLDYEFGKDMSSESRDYLAKMSRESRSIGSIVDALLDYARAGKFSLKHDEIQLQGLIGSVLLEHSDALRETKAYVRRGHMPRIKGHQEQIHIVIRELIANAIRHGKTQGTPTLEIWGELARDKSDFPMEPTFTHKDLSTVGFDHANWSRIYVKDNGNGFATTEQRRVFQPFVKLGRTNQDRPGLGLAVCKRIIRHMRGDIDAIGNLRSGALFRITLPHQPVGAAPR